VFPGRVKVSQLKVLGSTSNLPFLSLKLFAVVGVSRASKSDSTEAFREHQQPIRLLRNFEVSDIMMVVALKERHNRIPKIITCLKILGVPLKPVLSRL
jgi:hypothetical protein